VCEDAASESAAGLADETERQRNRMREVCVLQLLQVFAISQQYNFGSGSAVGHTSRADCMNSECVVATVQ
jgi:hypothetical protein